MSSYHEQNEFVSKDEINNSSQLILYRNSLVQEYYKDISVSIFYLHEIGPDILWHNYSKIMPHIKKMELDITLKQMAINYMVTLGMGHNYSEGVYDLPIPDTKRFRSLVACLYIDKLENDPASHNKSYIQFCIIVPTDLLEKIRSCSYFQDDLIKLLINHFPTDFNETSERELTNLIIDFLSQQLILH